MLPHVSCVAFYYGHISKSATDFGLDVWADADTKEMHNGEKCTPNGGHRQLHHTRLSCMRLATCQGQASVFSIHPSPSLPLSNSWTTIPSPPFTFLRARNVSQSKERVPLSKKIKVMHDCLDSCSTLKDFMVGKSQEKATG